MSVGCLKILINKKPSTGTGILIIKSLGKRFYVRLATLLAAAEGTGYFFINKISNIQAFTVLGGLKCEMLANIVMELLL